MGIFKTGEIKSEKEIKLVNSLIYKINQVIPTDNKYPIIDFIRDYTNRVIDGYDSVFKDITTIVDIFSRMIDSPIEEIEEFEDHFKKLEILYPTIVPTNSRDYEQRKNHFINDFVGADGVLVKEIYNEKVAVLFDNRSLYLDIISIINNNDIFVENKDLINKTIINISTEYSTGEKLRNAVIQYLDGFENRIDKDYEDYSKEVIEIAENRNGHSKLTSKEMAIMKDIFNKASLVLERIKALEPILDTKMSNFDTIVNNAVDLINTTMENNGQLQAGKLAIEGEKIIQQLNDYMIVLETALRQKISELFEEVRKEELPKIEAYREAILGCATLSDDYAKAIADYAQIQKASKEAVEEWNNKVIEIKKITPDLQTLLELQKSQGGLEKESTKEKPIVVSGSPTIIVPYTDIPLPKEIPTKTLPLLDQSIPYNERYDMMEKLIEENKKKGVKYHKKFTQAASALLDGGSLYLYGPSGSGKGYMLEQLASLFSYDKVIELSKITDKYTVEGYRDPQGIYRPSETYIAALYGYLLAQNELDNYDQNNAIMMNSIIDDINKKNSNQQQKVSHVFCNTVSINIHPNFRTIATGNTRGQGPNIVYPSREAIDDALLQRFKAIQINYDRELENEAITFENWKDIMKAFREACAEYARQETLEEVPGEITTRDIFSLQKTITNNRRNLEWIVEEYFTQTKDPYYLKAIGEFMAKRYSFTYESINKSPLFEDQRVDLKEVNPKQIAKTIAYQCKYLRSGSNY